jgi:alpha-tubulin suppressor-like RCC1 family protein
VCALLAGGAVRCWGANESGQLGLGNTTTIGDDESPTTNVNLGGATATAISAGGNHTCALLSTGAIRCWGHNGVGQLGLGNNTGSNSRIGDNEVPTVNVNLGATAFSVSAGANFTCAVLAGGGVRCWGWNGDGQLGIGNNTGSNLQIGDNENPTVNVPFAFAAYGPISAGVNHVCMVVNNTFSVICWGGNSNGQLGIGFSGSIGDNEIPSQTVLSLPGSAVSISAGSNHTCVILVSPAATFTARCWGLNNFGQIGIGTNTGANDSIEVPLTDVQLVGVGLNVYRVSVDGNHSCALFDAGDVRCWGRNASGQLGLANTTDIGDNELVTTNVDLGGTRVAATDTQAPVVSITSPTAGQAFSAQPVTISGTATDGVGVVAVGVAIYRNVAGGQYWNGSAWQSANTTVLATLSAPGAQTTDWSYVFNGPPGGVFATGVVAVDGASNVAVAPYRTFSVTDNTVPTVAITAPTVNQAFAVRPVAMSGTASDNAGVGDVQLAIYRPVGINGQFWNGAVWQTAYTTVSASLGAPGEPSTTWSYVFDPPQAGGLFYVAAIALDTSYRYSLTAFTPFTLPDSVPPTAVVLTPAANANIVGSFAVTGTATDNFAIARVGVAIYRVSTGQYWNGVTWQTPFATIPATLGTPGETTSTWSVVFAPPAIGQYLVAALPIDGSFNYFLTPFRTINSV